MPVASSSRAERPASTPKIIAIAEPAAQRRHRYAGSSGVAGDATAYAENMSARTVSVLLFIAIVCGGVLFGAVLQNILLGLVLGLLLATGYALARASWRRHDTGIYDDEDNGAQV